MTIHLPFLRGLRQLVVVAVAPLATMESTTRQLPSADALGVPVSVSSIVCVPGLSPLALAMVVCRIETADES